jgi:predicted nucleotidyltransferase
VSNSWLDISARIDPPLARVLSDIQGAAQAMDLPLLLVGAAARDMVMHLVHGIAPASATYDSDFGVRVKGKWTIHTRISS